MISVVIFSDFHHHNKNKIGPRSQGSNYLKVLQTVWKWLILVIMLGKEAKEAMKGNGGLGEM